MGVIWLCLATVYDMSSGFTERVLGSEQLEEECQVGRGSVKPVLTHSLTSVFLITSKGCSLT